ncbi:uncharacterized protein [Epargyreus clarus]|uniref:uncharacterized protein isoform X2 n=1 Tax=Epargyreus clarus TaxID=520877 RepID=UPI003C2DBDC5
MSKMAAKSKKRLSKNENKLLKLEKLELSDVICSICQSILIEPVTLPCYHDFCQRCFSGSIENNALCCPLCRLRIGSWLRKTSKQKCLVNFELWKFIKTRFAEEIEKKARGEDVSLTPEKPLLRLSLPGEIRSEYEAEIKRLRAERVQLEQKHLQETENLVKKLQEEEEEAHKQYIERLKHDEMLALKIQQENVENTVSLQTPKEQSKPSTTAKPKLKITKIDGYLTKRRTSVIDPIVIDDNTTSSDSSASSKVVLAKYNNRHSPEITPTYGKLLKNFLDKRIKGGTGIWNKENGKSKKTKSEVAAASNKETNATEDRNVVKTKNVMQSLVVSLPLPCSGILQHKTNETDNRSLETGSVDSMRQELCYFKPIEGTTPTSFNTGKTLPLRVPGMRVDKEKKSPEIEAPPSREQYIESLCQLRNLSLAQKLPSAFVITLSILRANKDSSVKCVTRSKIKKASPNAVMTSPGKRNNCNRNKQNIRVTGITEINTDTSLRRTRSMGSIAKEENEITPKKKNNNRKVSSERKPYLRSDSKKINAKKETCGSLLLEESINNNKVNLVVKNLSSPLDNCDVKNILREQLRIEKIIEQEKNDFELAQKVEAEWNGRRQLRRTATKRQVPLNYALRPAKKVKV